MANVLESLNDVAAYLHEWYLSLCQAGFSEEQAMQIVVAKVKE